MIKYFLSVYESGLYTRLKTKVAGAKPDFLIARSKFNEGEKHTEYTETLLLLLIS